ncbi:hypothetical protein D3C87_1316530 [compost metagenome]
MVVFLVAVLELERQARGLAVVVFDQVVAGGLDAVAAIVQQLHRAFREWRVIARGHAGLPIAQRLAERIHELALFGVGAPLAGRLGALKVAGRRVGVDDLRQLRAVQEVRERADLVGGVRLGLGRIYAGLRRDLRIDGLVVAGLRVVDRFLPGVAGLFRLIGGAQLHAGSQPLRQPLRKCAQSDAHSHVSHLS